MAAGLGVFRWVVERTLAWLHRFRRLALRYERRPDLREGFSRWAGPHHLALSKEGVLKRTLKVNRTLAFSQQRLNESSRRRDIASGSRILGVARLASAGAVPGIGARGS